MGSIEPWMRLKVKNDTFFLPDVDGTVYFRNNVGSFRMNGMSVQSWIEKLFPVWNGQHTLAGLTDGLPTPYKDRIYEVASILYDNGFLRDVSADEEHQLEDKILQYYGSQIEFVDNLVGAGAFRFQTYRNANVIVIGAGPMLVSAVGAMLESGLSTVNIVSTKAENTHMSRLKDLLALHNDLDAHVAINDLSGQVGEMASLRNFVQATDAVVYVSETGNVDELRLVESICSSENKLFLPAICVDGVGIVGPAAWPIRTVNMASVWDAAWRRIHVSVFQNDIQVSGFTATSGSVLANVLVFELFKAITGVEDEQSDNRFYTLNLQTLEGKWNDFLPGQGESELGEIRSIDSLNDQLTSEAKTSRMGDLLSYFTEVTDATSGIFHVWDEGNLKQLPLAQCRVQPIDGLSQGPAEVLTETVCTGLTHEEARLEAGLTGIEQYVMRLASEVMNNGPFVGIGAGSTIAEAIGRGLHLCLVNELNQAVQQGPTSIRLVEMKEVDDGQCQFYLQAMRTLGMDPIIGLGKEMMGFPVVWVGINGRFVGSAGFCTSMALQRALAYALQSECGDADPDARWIATISACVLSEEARTPIEVKAWAGYDPGQVTSAIEILAQDGKEMNVQDLALEPFLMEVLAGVLGISIRGEGVSQ